ncbi:putative phytochrome sensor protein [Comamonas testosteroni KF-1]|uniref:Putative phytochrome sensor protein n=2 Tax=Comamonas testosteroni TaxID=285 RepID=B7X309_COMTK|nr:putative phytochrome sensor protein [Comamonas testosteroni KF-1]
MSMSENRNEKSPSEESSPSPEVNFGAVAPTKPYAGAPVEVETLSREAGSAAEGRQPAPGLREGMDRRARANMAPGLVHLAEMLPALRLLIGLMIASIVILALYFGRDLLIPLALAMLFGFLLDPAVSRLKRWGLPRMASAIVVVAFALAALGGLGMYLGSQVQQLSADLPTYQSTIRDKLRSLRKSANMPSAWDGVFKTYNTVEKEIASVDSARARVQKVEVQTPDSKPTTRMLQWLGRIAEPVTTAGIVLLFVILILLDRDDLRDRLLRLVGGNLNLATDALDEASQRIGKYLRMQFIVNVSYGVPLAMGLLLIGVPGAILWGVLGAIMRFVPYVGPMMSAVFPLALAFAVDPGWNMFLLTLGLILLLELISNNVIEPWLYGSSTGLSTLSIIVAATFWTALWGPIGLILSTPLTVCLLVLGRYIPSLKFMEVLLGSEPVLGPQQRLYQRLLADDADDAISMAVQSVEERLPSKPGQDDRASAVRGFYDEVAIPALRIATQQHLESATAEHRLRLSNGMAALLEELQDQYAFRSRGEHARAASGEDDQRRCLRIHCAGVRWEVDALGAAMVAHAESLHGHEVSCSEWALAPDSKSLQFDVNGLLADREWTRAVKQSDLLVLSIFNHQPQSMARRIVRRIRRHWPGARVVLCLWNAPAVAADPDFARQTGAQACVTSLRELHLWVEAMQVGDPGESVIAAPIPDDDEQRVRMLHESGVLAPALTALYRDTAKKAVNAFNTKWAQVSWVDAERVFAPGSLLPLSAQEVPQQGFPRDSSVCSYVVYEEEAIVVGDLARDPRFANDSMVHSLKLRFYAGVPLTDKRGNVLGCLSILDDEPRNLSDDELEVLGGMARQLMDDVREALRQGPVVDA